MKFLLLVSLILFLSKESFAVEVRVCSHELPPHTMTENGKPSGFATEVLENVAKDLKWNLKITYSSWARLLSNASQGECDLVYTILKKEEYERVFLFPKEPLHFRKNVILVLSNSKITYDGDLKKFMEKNTIGTYFDKAVSKEFDQYKEQSWARVDYSVKAEDNFKKLLNSRFDAAIENDFTAFYYLKKLDKAHLVKQLEPEINITPAYAVFSKYGKFNSQINAFDQSLHRFKESNEYRDLVNRYQLRKLD